MKTCPSKEAIIRKLQGVAVKLTKDAELQKDLLQEMSIHLNNALTKLPGRTQSWYIKSCEFRARNYLKLGRSVDSRKRRYNLVSFDSLTEESGEVGVFANATEEARPGLIAQDLMEHIIPKLSKRQKEVLALLMAGPGVRQAGRKLGISHPAVIKHRNRIARIARGLISDTAD